jgi:DNA-binding PadR family transcriptional regulator
MQLIEIMRSLQSTGQDLVSVEELRWHYNKINSTNESFESVEQILKDLNRQGLVRVARRDENTDKVVTLTQTPAQHFLKMPQPRNKELLRGSA